MRRLISTLAAVLLAAGAILSTVGAASAGATARQSCSSDGSAFEQVTSSHGVNFYFGTPNSTFSGATVRLKPSTNSTTLWIGLSCPDGNILIVNRGLDLTSRATSPGGNVTVETAGNGGSGFASQHWDLAFPTGDTITFQNVRTGLFLRVPNSGPSNGKLLTTGRSATVWTQIPNSGSIRGLR